MSLRTLIVEDSPATRQFLVRVVRESFSDDIEFVEASSVEGARRSLGMGPLGPSMASGEGFRLILCDIEQPDGSGLELLAQLSDYPAIKLVTTLHSDDDHLFPALQCGATGYLLKEDRFEVLVEELQKIVRGQPPLSPAMARRLLGFFRKPESPHGPTDVGSSRLDATSRFGESGYGSTPQRAERASTIAEREIEVLTLLAKGYTVKEVATTLGIKWFAVNDHVRSVYRKLVQASSPQEALVRSRQMLDD